MMVDEGERERINCLKQEERRQKEDTYVARRETENMRQNKCEEN